MDPMKTHGAISWSELMTSDAAKAAEWYGTMFGWKIEAMPMPQGTYHVARVGETSIAGIMSFPAGAPAMPPAWGSYVTVNDVDASAKQAVALGGTLCAGPMDIPGVGRFAVLQDPQGAVINIMTYSADAA